MKKSDALRLWETMLRNHNGVYGTALYGVCIARGIDPRDGDLTAISNLLSEIAHVIAPEGETYYTKDLMQQIKNVAEERDGWKYRAEKLEATGQPPISRVLCFLEMADEALGNVDRAADIDGYETMVAAIGQAIAAARGMI